jgi:hypothetical protein
VPEWNELEPALANARMLICSWGCYKKGKGAGGIPFLKID